MKFTLLFACVVAAFVAVSGEETPAQVAARIFVLSVDEVQKCMDNTAVTVDDLEAMHLVAKEKSDNGIDQGKLTKTGCFFECVWEKHGWISGATMQMDNVRRIVDVHTMRDRQTRLTYYDIIDKCNNQVKELTNGCEVARDFSVCMLKDMPHDILGKGHSRVD